MLGVVNWNILPPSVKWKEVELTMTAALTMLKQGIERGVGSQKEAARLLNVTDSMLSKILSGERSLAPDLKPRVAKMHPLAGLAVALEATGYKIFELLTGDRHPQNLIRRVEKEDAEADEALRPIGLMLIDKSGPEDLADDDRHALRMAAREIIHRVRAELNLLVELEDRFRLGLLRDLVGEKEKAALQR
jgi:transcriptional regulator with XRE-family HTH domain